MSDLNAAAAEDSSSEVDDQVDLTDEASQSIVGSKRKPGRKDGDVWEIFKKVPNPNPGKTKKERYLQGMRERLWHQDRRFAQTCCKVHEGLRGGQASS